MEYLKKGPKSQENTEQRLKRNKLTKGGGANYSMLERA